ncbi:MAG: class I SAM-dependent methyltransferase [Granulosicoccus sp.]
MNLRKYDLGLCSDLEAIDQFLSIDGLSLVDAGCGGMHLSQALAARGATVLAIDPDPVQAQKNQSATPMANVSFAQTGAENVPADPHSVDGVLFPYSLHHIPANLYPEVFREIHRILKPDGFVYAMEPVATGALNEVMRLFHDEQQVRQSAQEALDHFGQKYFTQSDIISYRVPIQYQSWEEYASRYASKSYNTHYSEAQVRADAVRERFIELGAPIGYAFESPMKITYLRNSH